MRSNHGCFWIPNPDHSMSVKTDEKVFVRRKGVKTPSLPSTFVNAMAQYDSPSRSAPISSRKRMRESSASPLTPQRSKFPRVDIDLTDDQYFTMPPYSTWSPYGIHMKSMLIPHGLIPHGFHVKSMWNAPNISSYSQVRFKILISYNGFHGSFYLESTLKNIKNQ